MKLPVGSALRVDGAAADDWTHAIPPVSQRRVSLTFRRLSAETRAVFDDASAASASRKQRRKAERKARKKKHKKRAFDAPPAAPEKNPRSAPVALDPPPADGRTPAVELEHVRAVAGRVAKHESHSIPETRTSRTGDRASLDAGLP